MKTDCNVTHSASSRQDHFTCRYIARPAVSEQRLSLTATGKVRYQLKTPYRDGTTHVIFEPLWRWAPARLIWFDDAGKEPAMFLILAKTIENRDEDIFPSIQSLADYPDLGRLVPEFDQTFLGASRGHVSICPCFYF